MLNLTINNGVKYVKRWLWFFPVGLAIIVIIPLLLDCLIYNFNFNHIGSNETWLTFWGTYLGAIIGGLCTLFGVLIANKYQHTENEKRYRVDNRVIVNLDYIYQQPIDILKIIKHRPARLLTTPNYTYVKNSAFCGINLNFLCIHNPTQNLISNCAIRLNFSVINADETEAYQYSIDTFIPNILPCEKIYILTTDQEKT
jgi:hypothetical protein